jgi:hypothetical protein
MSKLLAKIQNRFNAFFTNPTKIRTFFAIVVLSLLTTGIANFYYIIKQVTDENIFQDSENGVTVISVTKGGASDRAGMQVGDVITRINGKTFENAIEADLILRRIEPGSLVEYIILRDDRELRLDVRLALFGINIYILFFFLTGLVSLITTALFGLLRPHLKEARLLFMTFFFWSMCLLLAGYRLSFLMVFQIIVVPIALMLLFYSRLYFPILRRDILQRRWLIRAYIGTTFVIATFSGIIFILMLKGDR